MMDAKLKDRAIPNMTGEHIEKPVISHLLASMSSWDQDFQKDVGDHKEKKIGLEFHKKVALDNAKKH
jgi:hypothetical protein